MTRARAALVGALALAVALALAPRAAAAQGGAAVAPDRPAQPLYKFALDYAVPESPGFAVLGLSPEKVLRGNAAKPVVTNLLSQVASGGRVRSGVALDVVPYFAYGGRLRSVNEYAGNRYKRALANLQLSFATVQSRVDTGSAGFGVGVRLSLADPHDLLARPELLQPVIEALNACGRTGGPPRPGALSGGAGDVTIRECRGLAEAFSAAKQAAKARAGFALAVGGGLGGRLRGAVADRDSLADRSGRVWLAGGYTFSQSQELQFVAQASDSARGGWKARGGIAARAKFPSVQLALETVYDGRARALQPGGVLEWRAVPGLWLVTSLGSETVESATPAAGDPPASRLRLRTSFRWNPVAAER